MNLFTKKISLIIITTLVVFLSGCYTQLETGRSYGYYDDYNNEEEVTGDGNQVDSVTDEEYDSARDRFYDDAYYPGASVAIGFGYGYYPWYRFGYSWGSYYPSWCFSYDPWYGWCLPYSYGWNYPYYPSYGYPYSGYPIWNGGSRRTFADTRGFGNTRGSGATRGYTGTARGSENSGGMVLPTAARGRGNEKVGATRPSSRPTVVPGSSTRTGTTVRSGSRSGSRGNRESVGRSSRGTPSRSVAPRSTPRNGGGRSSSSPPRSTPQVAPRSQPSTPPSSAPPSSGGGGTRSGGGSRSGRK
ncbi:MAG TPA: hypothetical protein VGB89_09540 [Bacteroidota bacterium]